jgi:DNA-binding transcriptional ArsR family regulator
MPDSEEHGSPAASLNASEAAALSESMQALSTASRVRLLYALLESDLTVEELARSAGITPSSASHQLRLLRHWHLVVACREGRHVRYRLHDHHVVEFLVAIRFHAEHVSMGLEESRVPVPDSEGTLI